MALVTPSATIGTRFAIAIEINRLVFGISTGPQSMSSNLPSQITQNISPVKDVCLVFMETLVNIPVQEWLTSTLHVLVTEFAIPVSSETALVVAIAMLRMVFGADQRVKNALLVTSARPACQNV
jgi:hypothetical protein